MRTGERMTDPYYGLDLGKQVSIRLDEQTKKDIRILAAHHRNAVVSDIVRQAVAREAAYVRHVWQKRQTERQGA